MRTLVREGETVAGKYRVERVLGVGGMGVVVAAHHLELDNRVAIKFLLPETAENPEAVERFAREARAAVKIKNEHVARVADVGKLADGTPYMVMEYLEGSDLAAWLAEHGPLPVEQAVEFVLQAGEAIAEAHSLGIVHRDLKPSNLFVTRRADGALSIKVLDFGISKMTSLGRSGASMTRTSVLVGSPMYMSPQQIRSSRDVDAQGDIWALGVILYELVTGLPPFDGEHLAELVDRIISQSPAPLRSHRPDVSEALERVIFKCLARDLNERFASVAELADALLPFASRRGVASVERISGIMAAKGATTEPPPPALDESARGLVASRPVQPTRTSQRGRLILTGVASLIAGLALVMAFGAGPSRSAAPVASSSGSARLVSPNRVALTSGPAPLVVSLQAALPATSPPSEEPSSSAAHASARPKIKPAPPAASATTNAGSSRADPFDVNSWGKFRR